MKIKLAILEKDQSYLNRIVTVFSTRYADKFEIYSFTDQAMAFNTLDSSRIDVLIANEAYDIDFEKIPKRCGFAYFVDSSGIDTLNDQRAICKFQRAELIYKQILSVYSENAGSVSGIKLGEENTQVIVFSSPCGGVGTSTVAAACASHYALNNKKSLYINLETFGSADSFFTAEGMFDMSDIIYALKSKKVNLAMKLESCVKKDDKGVFFYSQTKIALDMFELSAEDIIDLISELRVSGLYDYIILDMDFSIRKEYLKVYKQAHAVVWVGDGSEISNNKIQRAYNAISVMERNDEQILTNRLCLIYNKFSNKSGKTVGDIGIKSIGGAPRYDQANVKQVVDQLAPMKMFEDII